MTLGGVAQLGEHLPCKQGVSGSIPLISTKSLLLQVFDNCIEKRSKSKGKAVLNMYSYYKSQARKARIRFKAITGQDNKGVW